jgi:hypothetical protein
MCWEGQFIRVNVHTCHELLRDVLVLGKNTKEDTTGVYQ